MNPRAPTGPSTQSDPRMAAEGDEILQARLRQIRHRILVLSGKGGVGKSTVAANLACGLAQGGDEVGLLDIDLHGPSISKLLGLDAARLEAGPNGTRPVTLMPNLKVLSIGFLVESPQDAVIWRGPLKYKLIQQFLRDVDWGRLDYLIVDSPPGTGDEPLSVAQLMAPALAVVVTTPQDVAVADVRRSVTFCNKLALPVVGVIENMSGMNCPHCGKSIDLFKSGGGEALAKEMKVPFLGRVPLDPRVVQSGDGGKPFMREEVQSPAALAFKSILTRILSFTRSRDAVGQCASGTHGNEASRVVPGGAACVHPEPREAT